MLGGTQMLSDTVKKEFEEKLNGERLDIKFYPRENRGDILASVYITIGNLIRINNALMKIGSNGLYLQMPSFKDKDDHWKTFCFPTPDFHKTLNEIALAAFEWEKESFISLNEDNDFFAKFETTVHLLNSNQKNKPKAIATFTLPEFASFTAIRIMDDFEQAPWYILPGFKQKRLQDNKWIKYSYFSPTLQAKPIFKKSVLRTYCDTQKEHGVFPIHQNPEKVLSTEYDQPQDLQSIYRMLEQQKEELEKHLRQK